MKSISLALTWEFWRQAWSPLLSTTMVLVGIMALIYGGFRLDHVYDSDPAIRTSLQMFCFIFVEVGVVAVICGLTASPQYRFTLPVSVRTSVLIPMINGALATAISYLTVALLVNRLFDAQWTLVKPTLIAVCMFSVCQAVAWLIWASSNLRASIVAGVCTVLAVVVLNLSGNQIDGHWNTIHPIDGILAIVVPTSAYCFSFVVLTFARRGQVLSMAAICRWLLSKVDFRFDTRTHRMTPTDAELWAQWKTRGRVMPITSLLIASVLCVFFLSGRIEWRSACDGIVALTWLQVMIGWIFGLFLGHVGKRFDFDEHTASRPLSDTELADVKLRNTLTSVCWTWVAWTFGVVMAVVCLALVGQGPTSWGDIVRPGTPWFLPIVIVVTIPVCSWTLTSLGVSVVILRPWAIKALFLAVALLPFAPITLLYVRPDLEHAIATVLQWTWICATIVGTVAIYITAFRLRLITAKRMSTAGLMYLACSATWLGLASFLPRPELPLALGIGFVLSSCLLPFVCVGAVPLSIWWNRHR